VSSPLLGVSGPRRTEKGENEIFVIIYRSQWGIFAFLQFLSDISATRGQIHAKLPTCPFPLWGSSAPGGGRGGVKNSKNGGLIRVADSYHFYFFSALPNVVQYVQNCSHSGVELSRSAMAFLEGGPKRRRRRRSGFTSAGRCLYARI